MNILDNSLLTILLTLAATFLGLSIVVQVIQEFYKYLRSSKGRAYQQALLDFLGPLAHNLMRPGILSDIRVRGPFQLLRLRPKGVVLPLKQKELITALEKTTPMWIQRTLKQLELEVEYQSDKPSLPSHSWKEFLEDLGKTEQGALGYWSAFEIAEFLKEWKYDFKEEPLKDCPKIKRIGKITPPKGELDANKLLLVFRKRFIPHIENASENFSKLTSNFEYTYQRSNRRLTFIIAIIITILFNLQIDVLYQNASETDPATAIQLAETTMEIYNNRVELPDTLITANLELAKKLMNKTLKTNLSNKQENNLIDLESIPNPFSGDFAFIVYLLYTIITAIFITFGAPFWNDIASALLKLQKNRIPANDAAGKEVRNG